MENFYAQIQNIVSKYNSNKIFVIGKGKSVDQIDFGSSQDALIININDSGLIVKGTITIFHKPWVIESLSSGQYATQLYVTDRKQDPIPLENVAFLDYQAFDEIQHDLFIYNYLNNEIALCEILFITAAKLCSLIASIKSTPQEVYFIGFDFSLLASSDYSEKIRRDFSGDDIAYKKGFITNQEFYFVELLNLYSEGSRKELKIFHVGNKAYSALSPEKFNQIHLHKDLQQKSDLHAIIQDNSKLPDSNEAGQKSKVKIVAEFTNNHLGNIERLKQMVYSAKKAGADLIKVQKRDVEGFYTQEQMQSFYSSPFGKTFGDYRRGVELDEKGFTALDNVCKAEGIEWFASILDYNSYVYLKNICEIRLMKIPSTVSNNIEFHSNIARKYHGQIVISTGYTNKDYETHILNTFKQNEKIYLLQCTSAYPAPPYECNLAVVRHYYNLSKTNSAIIPGYSSHDIGSIGSMLAVAAGAQMIEKHVKMGNTNWVHFDNVALDLETDEFKKFVKDIRLAEQMCGDEVKAITNAEHHKYFGSKKK